MLHPAADPGVHWVQDLRRACPQRLGSTPQCPTLQSLPLLRSGADRRRPALPPCHCANLAIRPDFEAFFRGGVRCRGDVAAALTPDALLGFPPEAYAPAPRPKAACKPDTARTRSVAPHGHTAPRRRTSHPPGPADSDRRVPERARVAESWVAVLPALFSTPLRVERPPTWREDPRGRPEASADKSTFASA